MSTKSGAAGFFSILGHMTIKAKVFAGFVAVLALLGLVGAVGALGFRAVSASLTEYEHTTKNAVGVTLLDRNLIGVRRFVLAYTVSGDPSVAARVREGAAEAKKDIAELIANTTNPERKAKLVGVERLVDDYIAGFEKIAKLHDSREQSVKERIALGTQADQKIGIIASNSLMDREFEIAAAAGALQSAIMTVRLNANRFQATPDEKLHTMVLANTKTAENALSNLETRVKDATQYQELLKDAKVALTDYTASFAKSAQETFEIDTLVNKTMADMAAKMANDLGEVRKSQLANLKEVGTTADNVVATSSLLSLVLSLGAFVLGVALAWLLGRGISRPVVAMTDAMQKLAGGDKTVVIPAQGRRDEIGRMAGAVEIFKQNIIEADRLRAEQEQAKARAEQDKRAAMTKMADEFESSVKGIVQMVSSASTELETTAQSMSATAEETQRQSAAVAAASEQASTNVQTVATAAEELSASITEIGRQVSESARIAGQAVDDASRTNTQVQALAEAATRIGDVVKLINDIAGQTNLLALNATIEAARAGEAGKGFAVVASEVKSLATQTAKATEDIATQIKAIQGATTDSVQAIQGIGQTIGRINEIATTIASAVEEQGAATKEIARNVQQASSGTNEVSSNITGVTRAATDTGAASNQVLGAAGELSKQSESLKGQVEAFIGRIRAA
ncbi:MAG TPA: HAMP domain-containing methyl-accepting chemotaxis protein [Alphaproteobacteria bacterium]